MGYFRMCKLCLMFIAMTCAGKRSIRILTVDNSIGIGGQFVWRGLNFDTSYRTAHPTNFV